MFVVQGCIEEGGVWSVQSCLHTDPWLCVLCCISAAWIVIRIGELLECMAKAWRRNYCRKETLNVARAEGKKRRILEKLNIFLLQKKKYSQTFSDVIVQLEQRVNANKELNCP